MNTPPRAKSNTLIILISLALLPFVYVGSYFAILALPSTIRLPQFLSTGPRMKFFQGGHQWEFFPDYHGLPDWLFAPIHKYDRDHLRPGKWSGSSPRDEEFSFDWLEKAVSPAITPAAK